MNPLLGLRRLKKLIYGSFCLRKDGTSNFINIPIRLITAKSIIGKWGTRLLEMMSPNEKAVLNVLQKTRDPRVSLAEPKFNFDKLYHENHINGDTRPMARDGDQIAFFVKREIGRDFGR
jgi:hypothetical protein